MNNKRRVYRLAKGSNFYNVGPYGYLINKMYIEDGISEERVKPIKDLMYSRERWAGSKYEDIIFDLLKKNKIFEQQGCFSTYKAKRPGPWDDPVLKSSVFKKFGNRENLSKLKVKWWGFAFDSMNQFNDWFYDDKELKMLEQLGFRIHSENISEANILYGLRQIWIIKT